MSTTESTMSQGNNPTLASTPEQLTGNEKEVFAAKVKGFSEEHEKNYETILKQESEIAQLKKRLEVQQEESKLEYTQMVAKYEKQIASYEVGLMFQTPGGETQSGSELQTKVDQLEEQIRQRDIENLELSKRNEGLCQNAVESKNQLMVKIDELAHSESAWEAKYTALDQEFNKDLRQLAEDKNYVEALFRKYLAEKEYSWNAEKKLLQEEISELEEVCLREKGKRGISFFKRDLGDRHTALHKMKSKVQNKMEKADSDNMVEEPETSELEEKLAKPERQAELQRKVDQLEEQIRQKDIEILELSTRNKGQLDHSESAWEAKHNDLDQEFNKDLIEIEKYWEAMVRELFEDKNYVEEQFKKHLAEKEHCRNVEKKLLQEEISELEEVCLREKGKRRISFFKRNLGNRHIALHKMKCKV